MRILYVPAAIDGLINVLKRCELPENRFGLYKGKYDPSWWSDKAIFQHQHVLTSYYYARKHKDYLQSIKLTKKTTLWADSGGYTIATKGAKIDPMEALKWQEENSNIAFTLDHPPTIITKGTQISPGKNERVTEEVFEQHAEKTRQNNLVFANNRTNPNLLIYNVMHGYDLKSRDLWWDYTTRDTKFEGYATGNKPTNDYLLQAMTIMYLWDKGVRQRVHLLGVSGVLVIPVLVWASQYIDKVSFDSTSYGYGSLTRAYVYPDRIRDYTHFGRKYETKDKPMEKIYCKCPICIDFETPEYFIGDGSTWPGLLLALHNLWCTKQYVEELDRVLNVEKNKEKFFQLVHQHTGGSEKTLHAINFIEDCMKYGFKKSYEMYFSNHNYAKPKLKSNKLF